MIKLTDRDGMKLKIMLRGGYSHITSQKALKSMLDDSTSIDGLKSLHPTWPAGLAESMSECYSKKSYREIMRLFGMISRSEVIKK